MQVMSLMGADERLPKVQTKLRTQLKKCRNQRPSIFSYALHEKVTSIT